MERVEITIIGAGVIGLNIAAELSEVKSSVLVLEKNISFGMETSSRNSEVIHAGIYYPKDSLKARTCLEGNCLLYELCERNKIPCKKIGKLIVAVNDSEIEELEHLLINAQTNGVSDIKLITSDRIRQLEPNIKAKAALYSPSTGIIDSHSLMEYFLFKAKTNGAIISFKTEVQDIERNSDCYKVTVEDADKQYFSFLTNIVINCAGLNSDTIAQKVGIDIERQRYALKYSKGQYFRVNTKKSGLINRLVYPVPSLGSSGLGIHATPDLGGSLRLGPDDKYILRDNIDYNVNQSDKDKFFKVVSRFLPFIELENLSADTAGIRPKLQGEGEEFRDFIIKEESNLGFPGFVNLIGIESPGLTASPAIARYVAHLLKYR